MESLCNYEMLLWRCMVEGWELQEKCKFAIKAPGRNEFLYACLGRRCDSISAQRAFESEDKT